MKNQQNLDYKKSNDVLKMLKIIHTGTIFSLLNINPSVVENHKAHINREYIKEYFQKYNCSTPHAITSSRSLSANLAGSDFFLIYYFSQENEEES